MTGGGDATVLVVEDQKGLAEAYSAVLSAEYTVLTAFDGEEALAVVDNENDVDVVLLDRRMPGMSGDEVLAELTERGVTAKVAMLTAVEPDTDIVDMPFDDYVTKPVNNDQLLSLVETLLMWATYDEYSQEFFRFASKKKALESADREYTEEYKQIVDRMKEIQAKVDATLDELSEASRLTDVDVFR